MSNFSDFFPAAGGGGGGFTKQNKYSTLRSADATYKAGFTTTLRISGDVLIGYTTLNGRPTTTDDQQYFTAEDSYVGMTFTETGQTHTVTASTAHSAGSYATLTFTPALSTGQIANGENILFNGAPFTVNPATDLGLEDGSQIGYMLVGAGYSGNADFGGRGGKIISGTATIVTASTDLIFTPGVANGGSSTISGGGLALSSGDGSNASGFSDFNVSSYSFTAGSGNMGYGAGGGRYYTIGDARNYGTNYHGYGVGAFQTGGGGDGAILLFY